jgi:Flp pilus assembly pilin Flp
VRQRGQESVEYALIVASIAILTLLAGVTFGSVLQEWFNRLLQRLAQS